MRMPLFFHFLFLSSAFAASVDSSASPTSTATPVAPLSTACSDIVNSCGALEDLLTFPRFKLMINAELVFTAQQAFDCLSSVPFNPGVATQFLTYYNDTLQFHSTSAYLKNPPTSYQQPAVDLLHGLSQIQLDVNDGVFENQYAFEATLQNLVQQAHDTHLVLDFGILNAFSFGSPYGIVSVSPDGVENPKIYSYDDIVEVSQDPTATWQPSAIVTINGRDVNDFLTQYAAVNAIGGLEPHADWNLIMSSSALDIQDYFSVFEGLSPFFPGDNLSFAFENGTQIATEWYALYNSPGPTGPLTTGGDFFNFFVLGIYPASFNTSAPDPCLSGDAFAAPTVAAASSTTATSSASSYATSFAPEPIATSWPDSAYPENADVFQPNLYPSGGGFLTGYFLNDSSIAVISIPSFQMYGDDASSFSNTVAEFLQRSREAGMTKVVIDVQQNFGGDTLLAFDTFKQFFPSINPFGGSRLRAHPSADILGNTFTTFYNTNGSQLDNDTYAYLSDSNWVASDRIDASTGANFTSWGEYFGPHLYNGDYFTTTQRDNFSSVIFDEEAGGLVVYGFGDRPATSPQPPFAADNIIILTDGTCASTCALFMEMMHHEAGVRTVVVGGRPEAGPMQAPAGTRGALSYDSVSLDIDIGNAETINITTTDYLPDRAEDQAVWISTASFNMRDQVRNGENIPLQFVYEAADCRIFYTFNTIYNYTNLWQYAANAIWSNPGLCVQGSTGYATTNSTVSNTQGPPGGSTVVNANVSHNVSALTGLSGVSLGLHFETPGEADGPSKNSKAPGQVGSACTPSTGCIGALCRPNTLCQGQSQSQCFLRCNNFGSAPCSGLCQYTKFFGPGEGVGRLKGQQIQNRAEGYCIPFSAQCLSSTGPGFADEFKSGESDDASGEQTKRQGYLTSGGMGDLIKAGLEALE